jgi:hypothetical protein
MTPEDHRRRGVAFLISTEDGRLTAKSAFDRLDETAERGLRTRFDAWVGRQPPKPHRYHGWNREEFGGKYTECFVFKYTGGKAEHHFYGFLCHPKEPGDPSYQACVLVVYAWKGKHKTDEADLRRTEEIRTAFAVQKACKDHFRGRL